MNKARRVPGSVDRRLGPRTLRVARTRGKVHPDVAECCRRGHQLDTRPPDDPGRDYSTLEGNPMKRVLWALPLTLAAVGAASVASAQPPSAPMLTGLTRANTKSP